MLRVTAIAVAVLTLGGGHVAQETHAPRWSLSTLTPALAAAGAGSIDDIAWSERVYSVATGETVDVSVSTAYADAEEIGRHWADFYAALPHGDELGRLEVYVAPLDQIQTVCGRGAVGCYGDGQLLQVNEAAMGFAAEEVARHEYGHHIALNRLNTPWPAFDWGPKRWATAANICALVRSGGAYPGEESLLYRLNPGEAFAEAYRVLIDTQLGETRPAWPLVDSRFYPDREELDAVAQDVAAPWTGRRMHVFQARLDRRGVWERRLSTPLDGTLAVDVSAPRGVHARVALRGRFAAKTEICGERSIAVVVRANNAPGRRIAVRVTLP